MEKLFNVEAIARVCHEANRAYCSILGDDSQPPWLEAPKWQRESAISGVKFHIENPKTGPSGSHENWMRDKIADGWKYGEKKNPETKEHPCMVPYGDLPVEQRMKDAIFTYIVHAMVIGGGPQ